MLQKQSGMLGLTGLQRFRDRRNAENGNRLSVGFSHECLPNKKYIGSYAAVLNGLDAIIFYSRNWRKFDLHTQVMHGYGVFGIELDASKMKFVRKQLEKSTHRIQRLKYWLFLPMRKSKLLIRF
jgi:acetate kinase